MNTYYYSRSSRGVAHCSSSCNGPSAFLLDVLDDPLHLGEQQVPRFGLDRVDTAFMKNPGRLRLYRVEGPCCQRGLTPIGIARRIHFDHDFTHRGILRS
jgi:hypothetical protein